MEQKRRARTKKLDPRAIGNFVCHSPGKAPYGS